jgi:DNA repair exonuclease SbcCD ATPase subunit
MSASPQIVTVLGERVSLVPTTFQAGETFLVPFEKTYKYPDMTGPEEAVVKKLFQTLFSGSTPFLPTQEFPSPPCSPQEKTVLLKSLKHRFSLLRNELVGLRKLQSDSLRLRQVLTQMETMKRFIDFAETSKDCKEMDEDILAEALGDLNDEQILQLLRQFVFFILQGSHPMQPYLGRDPNPKGFVARLDRNPLPNFQEFMKDYRGQNNPVPLPIEKVLQATEMDLGAMKSELDSALQVKVKEIQALLEAVIPKDNPFWQNLDRNDVTKIVDRLLEVLQGMNTDLQEVEAEKEQLQGGLIDLENQRERLALEKTALENKLKLLESEKNSLSNSLSTSTASSEDVEELKVQYDAIIAELEEKIQELEEGQEALALHADEMEEKAKKLEATLNEKQAQLQALQGKEAELTKLKATVDSLTTQLEETKAKLKGCEELQAKVATLEKEVKSREAQLTELRQNAGELTAKIDQHIQEKARIQAEVDKLNETQALFESLEQDITQLLESLSQDKQTVLDILNSVQRDRSSYASSDDEILKKIAEISSRLKASNDVPTSMASDVSEVLRLVQSELTELRKQIKELEDQRSLVESQIVAAKESMAHSNEILSLIRAGRSELDAKGFKLETDKALVEEGIQSIELASQLKTTKDELEETVRSLMAQNGSLQGNIEALQSRMTTELADLTGKLKASTEELGQERRNKQSLEGKLLEADLETKQLSDQLAAVNEESQRVRSKLEEERVASANQLKTLEETKLRECEERLAALRQEEQEKRDALASAQGLAKGELQIKVNDLLKRITLTEGERDGFKAEVEVVKGQVEAQNAALEAQKAESAQNIKGLEGRLAEAQAAHKEAAAQALGLQGEVVSLKQEVEDLSSQIISDTTERQKLFDLIGNISSWIASGSKLPKPSLDETLNTKYRFNRILESVEASLPQIEENEGGDTADSSSVALGRCYLVFFMTYVYSRHFPSAPGDKDAAFKSVLTEFLNDVLKQMYTQLDVGIPGKLEAVGSGGIPVQLKSKYMWNLLIPLIKAMELVHESGKQGADFLKFKVLDQDQLETLHKLHKVLKDKLINPRYRTFMKELATYVKLKTGAADTNIENLYLRFYHETKTNREYPVIMFGPAVSKYTFATDLDFSQFLSSPLDKSGSAAKLAPPQGKELSDNPVFTFNILFYLFLFFLKDYLSSVEGELVKAGCPLPPILKRR